MKELTAAGLRSIRAGTKVDAPRPLATRRQREVTSRLAVIPRPIDRLSLLDRIRHAPIATLPWSTTRARCIGDVSRNLAESIPQHLAVYLPAKIELYADAEVPAARTAEFLANASEYLIGELERRVESANRFVEKGLFTPSEIRDLLTARRNLQPWALYDSARGGLGSLGVDQRGGVIPCTSMQNHGVACRIHENRLLTWLATAPKPETGWDYDADIGHESCHAAFAHVPLFVQGDAITLQGSRITGQLDPLELQPGQLARMAYVFAEVPVLAVRGERRATETQLPIETWDELIALLEISARLMPGIGFEGAVTACRRAHRAGSIEDAIHEIAAPMLRLQGSLCQLVTSLNPPPPEWYAEAAARARRTCPPAIR